MTMPNFCSSLSNLRPCYALKRFVSSSILFFAIAVVTFLVFNRQTKISQDIHPAIAFIILVGGLICLSMLEGGQCALVGLSPISMDLYTKSHPITHKCISTTNMNLDRYLMGRQLLVILIIFAINLAGSSVITNTSDVLSNDAIFSATLGQLPSTILGFGEAATMILIIVSIGQINSQINASRCMLDYLNSNFALFMIYVAMAIETSGLMHVCYLIRFMIAYLAGKPVDSNECTSKTVIQKTTCWVRVFFSLSILAFATVAIVKALFDVDAGKTVGTTTSTGFLISDGVVSVFLFFVLIIIGGLLEGMQVAIFSFHQLSMEEQMSAPTIAKKSYELVFKDGGRNLPRFTTGRQICITTCFVFIARLITSVEVNADDNASILGRILNNAGLLSLFFGALITASLGSISWQFAASAFPVVFLTNPMVYVILRFCLILEASGICSATDILALAIKKIIGYQVDEVYIGTHEERIIVADEDMVDTEIGISITTTHSEETEQDNEDGENRDDVTTTITTSNSSSNEEQINRHDIKVETTTASSR